MRFFVTGVGGQLVRLYKRNLSSGRLSDKSTAGEEYGLSKAARPFNSRLAKGKLVEAGFVPLPI